MILNEKGYYTKQYTSKFGKTCGGIKFKTTNIQLVLRNVLYVGKVKYNGELYPGMHEAIISDEIFDKAQVILVNNNVRRKDSKYTRNQGFLNHILRCKACNCIMSHTYTKKGPHKYQYYVCVNAQKRGYVNCPTRSVNAQVIEDAVIDNLRTIAANSTDSQKELKEALIVDSPIWETLFPQQKHEALKLMVREVRYSAADGKLNLTLNHDGIKRLYSLLHPELKK
jgi:site-specific DNA recombinase